MCKLIHKKDFQLFIVGILTAFTLLFIDNCNPESLAVLNDYIANEINNTDYLEFYNSTSFNMYELNTPEWKLAVICDYNNWTTFLYKLLQLLIKQQLKMAKKVHKRYGFPNCTVILENNRVFLTYTDKNAHEEYVFNTHKEAENEFNRLTKIYKR